VPTPTREPFWSHWTRTLPAPPQAWLKTRWFIATVTGAAAVVIGGAVWVWALGGASSMLGGPVPGLAALTAPTDPAIPRHAAHQQTNVAYLPSSQIPVIKSISGPSSVITEPGRTVTSTAPGSVVPGPTSLITLPGNTVTSTAPGSVVTAPGSIVTSTAPGSVVTAPGSVVTAPGSVVTAPGSVVTAPGSQVTVTQTEPGQTVTITAPADPVPAVTVTEPAQPAPTVTVTEPAQPAPAATVTEPGPSGNGNQPPPS
jgi:hypothetical protein